MNRAAPRESRAASGRRTAHPPRRVSPGRRRAARPEPRPPGFRSAVGGRAAGVRGGRGRGDRRDAGGPDRAVMRWPPEALAGRAWACAWTTLRGSAGASPSPRSRVFSPNRCKHRRVNALRRYGAPMAKKAPPYVGNGPVKPQATSCKLRATSAEPQASRRKPQASSLRPRATSRELRASSIQYPVSSIPPPAFASVAMVGAYSPMRERNSGTPRMPGLRWKRAPAPGPSSGPPPPAVVT